MITRALFVRLEAKTGREQEVESFLRDALNAVDAEDGTVLWFALRFGPSSFAIFDAFPDDEARQAHLSGEVASSLMENAPQLLASDPTIERADVLAGKVDARRCSRSRNSDLYRADAAEVTADRWTRRLSVGRDARRQRDPSRSSGR